MRGRIVVALSAAVACIAAVGGVCGKPTGFYHVESIDGRDWIVNPRGQAVFLAGVDYCGGGGFHCEALGYSPYGRFVASNYTSRAEWAANAARRLSSWGFNFLGTSPDPSLKKHGFAYANGSDLLYFSNRLCQGDPDRYIGKYRFAPGTALPNVFHPGFEKEVARLARERCAPHRDDPGLVGWFLDNELDWWGLSGAGDTGIFGAVSALPDGHTAKKALVAFVAGRPVTREVKEGFLAMFAERYFSVIAGAVRAVDPNHLILGCRFAGVSHVHSHPALLGAAARHCDVVSFNVYPWADLDRGVVLSSRGGRPLAEVLRALHAKTGKPLMITEWGYSALDSGLPCTAGEGQRFRTQAERAKAVELTLKTFLAMPFIVGYDWFMWLDQPALGHNRYFGENTNYGLVNERDEPYGEVTAAFSRIQRDILRWRKGKPPEGDASVRAAPPSERERFVSDVPRSADVVKFSRERDGWVMSNSYVRISGRNAAAPGLVDIAFGGRTVGRLVAQVECGGEGFQRRWMPANGTISADFTRDANTGVGVAALRASGGAFALELRLHLAPGRGDILTEVVAVENTGKAPINVRAVFLQPFAIESKPAVARLVPNLWDSPKEAYWQLSDGALWGGGSHDSSLGFAKFSVDSCGVQHPDLRFAEGRPFALAPGKRWLTVASMSARLVFRPGE